MSSGISSSKEQAGHGSPFVSFSTVFNNYFLPEVLPDLMDTSVKEQETYSLKEGDILVTRTSETIDELAMSCVALKDYPKATYSGFTKRLRPMTEEVAYHKYMAFYLRGELFRKAVTNNAFMTLRASFNEDIFSFLNLYLPPYDEQVKIGDLLYEIEQKTQLNNKIISELEAMAETIYEYWFVQFDYPNEVGKPYKSSGGKMVLNDKLKREIPLAWNVLSLGDIAQIDKHSFNPSSYGELIVEHYSIPAYDAGAYPVFEKASSIGSGKYKVTKENILVSKLNPHFKRIWDPMCITGESICSTEFIPFTCTNNDYRSFLYTLLNSKEFFGYMCFNASSSTGSRKRLTPEDTLWFHFAMPDKDILTDFLSRLNVILERIKLCRKENQELLKTRAWLLPMLLNGQVKIEQ